MLRDPLRFSFHPITGQVQLQSPERVAQHMLHWYRRSCVVDKVDDKQYRFHAMSYNQSCVIYFSCYHWFCAIIGLALFSVWCYNRCHALIGFIRSSLSFYCPLRAVIGFMLIVRFVLSLVSCDNRFHAVIGFIFSSYLVACTRYAIIEFVLCLPLVLCYHRFQADSRFSTIIAFMPSSVSCHCLKWLPTML